MSEWSEAMQAQSPLSEWCACDRSFTGEQEGVLSPRKFADKA